MIAGCVSLLLSCAALAGPEAPVVVLADGRVIAATNWSIDGSGRLIVQEAGQPAASPWTAIESPALVDAAVPARAAQWSPAAGVPAAIRLVGGELLHAVILDPDSPGTIRVESAAFGPQRLAIEQVSRIDLAERRPVRPGARRSAEAPCVLLVNGDLIAGAIKSITPQAVTVDSVFGEAETDMSQVVGIEIGPASAGTDTRGPDRILCVLTDGQQWHADRLEPGLGKGRCRIRRAGKSIDLAVSEIRQLVFAGWRVRELVTLDPPEVQTTPYLGERVEVQIDDASNDRHRVIGSRTFLGGLTTRPRCRIRYPLTPGAVYLTGWVGLDPLRGRDGICEVRVEGDGKTLVRIDKLTAADGARRIATAIDGGDHIVLVTDFGPQAELGDCVNWCELAFVEQPDSVPAASQPHPQASAE